MMQIAKHKRWTMLLAALALGACDMAQMEADSLDSMELTDQQREVAEALIVGYKKERGNIPLRSRDIAHAACYARSVRIASSYHDVHLKYLRDYTAIDKDFYPWFRRQGMSDDAAYKLAQWVQEGFEECTMGALLKKRFSND